MPSKIYKKSSVWARHGKHKGTLHALLMVSKSNKKLQEKKMYTSVEELFEKERKKQTGNVLLVFLNRLNIQILHVFCVGLEPISEFAYETRGSGFERSEAKNLEEYRDISRNF